MPKNCCRKWKIEDTFSGEKALPYLHFLSTISHFLDFSPAVARKKQKKIDNRKWKIEDTFSGEKALRARQDSNLRPPA